MEYGDSHKDAVRDFWDASPCGQTYARGSDILAQMEAQALARYSLEPYLQPFADFQSAAGRDVLEIGVGVGADHLQLAKSMPNSLTGVDITPEAVEWTKRRLHAHGYSSNLRVADAESLPFDDETFSLVYSWGVLHHSPDTQTAVDELYRVLSPGGEARVMIYNRHSIVGYALWIRYALLTAHPWRSLDDIYAEHLESPGTKAYTPQGARDLFSAFPHIRLSIQLSFADLMAGDAGQQHGPTLMAAARKLWPHRVIQRFFREHGLYLLVTATK